MKYYKMEIYDIFGLFIDYKYYCKSDTLEGCLQEYISIAKNKSDKCKYSHYTKENKNLINAWYTIGNNSNPIRDPRMIILTEITEIEYVEKELL